LKVSVTDRLKRLTGENKPQASADDRKRAQLDDLRRRIESILERRPGQTPPPSNEPRRQPIDLMAVARGEEIVNRFGKFFVAHDCVEQGAFYGRNRIRELAALNMDAAAVLAGEPRLAALTHGDALYLDTETTGLAGGTGTLAFLVGVGWYDETGFVTQRLFARDFTEEPAMLAHLAELARAKKWLVTFNGKTFDVGLLAARFTMNRLDDPLGALPHLDLLHPARRLLGHRLENARLVTLEEQTLGLRREGDIPGSEIPQRYFDWLRYRDARLVADILEHNRLDVISMAMLALHLTRLLAEGVQAQDAEPADVLAAARLQVERGDAERARCLLEALATGENAHAADHARRLLSLVHKRAERWDEAVQLWEALLTADPGDLFAGVELAKFCEHRAKDHARAAALVERLLDDPRHAEPETRAELRHRLDRLRRRGVDK